MRSAPLGKSLACLPSLKLSWSPARTIAGAAARRVRASLGRCILGIWCTLEGRILSCGGGGVGKGLDV